MPMTKETALEVDRLRGLLAEARRYVRSKPDVAREMLEQAMEELVWFAAFLRLADNLYAGLKFIRAAPDVLEGYIDGASYELLAAQGRRQESIA